MTHKTSPFILALLLAGIAMPLMAHNVAVTPPGLDGSNFKLEMQYLVGAPAEAFVLDNTPNAETTYRASMILHLPSSEVANMPSPSFIYFFQTFGSGFFTGPAGPALRAGIHKVNGQYNARLFAFDNQRNRRGTGNCVVPLDQDVRIQIEWYAENAANAAPPNSNLKLSTFNNLSSTPSCTSSVIGGLNALFIRQNDQMLITKPDAATVLTGDVTWYIDDFASFRSLAP